MSQEKRFHKILSSLGIFYNIDINFMIRHTSYPSAFIEVDNIAQKKTILFVFEAKSKDIKEAISQLKERYTSLTIFKQHYIDEKHFNDYPAVRLFYYSLKKKRLVEIERKGIVLFSYSFDNLNELKDILRKI